MAYVIKLPAVAADASGGTLQRWLKQEGERVSAGDVLAEVETDKAIVEITAEKDGTLGRILIEAGTASVAVNTVLAVATEAGEGIAAIEQALAAQGASPVAPRTSSATATAAAAIPAAAAIAQPTMSVAISTPTQRACGRILSSPAARYLAAQWHIDLATLTGSGPNGRILRHDVVLAHQSQKQGHDAAPAFAVAPLAARSTTRRIPHSNMRRAIARRLSESKQTVPHFYLTLDCRMDALLALRAQANQSGAAKISVNDFIVRAAALALRAVPEVNAAWSDDAIEYHAGADISVAVATDGGLVTPIVRDADIKPLSSIAMQIAELAERARANRLKVDELTGGSLTISNLGMYGIREFAAIINPPQAAILAVGAAEKRAVVDANGTLAAATLMTVTLSADHRVIDGATGARWLAAFKEVIENPVRILL